MRRLLVGAALVVALAGCNSPGEEVDNPSDSLYTWSYVDGPNGETCLVAVSGVAQSSTAMMDCDWSTAND